MSTLPNTFVPGFHNEDAVRRMKYNSLGQTGLKVSALSLGCGSFSHLYGNFDENEAIQTVVEAIKNGINYIDTAYWYGQGSSETILGKALKNVPRQAYYIATKVGRYELEPKNMFDFSAEKTRANFNECLKRLQLNYVDIIQVHDIEFAPSLDIIINETLPTLYEFVETGRATYIGVTGYPVSILKECIQKSKTIISVILSYSRMTLIDDTLSKYIPYFQMQGIGIVNAASPAMGLLTNNGPQSWHPANDEIKQICREAANFCKENGVELGRIAVAYCYEQNGIATSLIGMNNRELLKSNLDLLYNGLNEKEQQIFEQIKMQYFSKLKQAHWENVQVNEYKKNLLNN